MIPTDSVFDYIKLTLGDLCDMKHMPHTPGPSRPDFQPLILDVEAAPLPKDTPEGTPPTAYRYALAFPGSGYMKLAFKVQESKPSITAEQLAEKGGAIPANIEGFSFGTFETDNGGIRAYFKATKIAPAAQVPTKQ